MSKKILIVDDDPTSIALVNFLMKTNGFQTALATEGIDGLKKAQEERPDLIVLDVQMPKMDGYTFLSEMKKNEALSNIPVVMLTSREYMEELFKMEGVKDYFVKPVDAEKFVEKIKSLINDGK